MTERIRREHVRHMCTKGMLCIILLAISGLSPAEHPVVVAWWNVENLFDTVNDVDPLPAFGSDDEFTPDGARHWTAERYAAKVKAIAMTLRSMNDGKGPDIIGVCEVEHEHILRTMIREYLPDLGYDICYHESPDARGIDVAFLYRAADFHLVATGFRPVPAISDTVPPTRDILYAMFDSRWGRLLCIGNHWPSRRTGFQDTEPRRILAAQTCRSLLDSLLNGNPALDAIIMGDFNDDPSNASVMSSLGASGERRAHQLYNCMSAFKQDGSEGTIRYRGKWNLFDQFILAPALFDSTSFRLISVEIYKRESLLEQSGKYAGSPFPTFGGSKYLGGASDHLPIILSLEARSR